MDKQFEWAETLQAAVTVCDLEGRIVYMNARSRETFDRDGETMLGKNLFPCHNERSQQMIRHMMATGTTNAYTISKNGVRKMIFQSPWKCDGEVAGMVELSMIIPEEMPHHQR